MKRKRIDGDEQDAYSRNWRRWHRWRRGELAAIKRRTHKRERAEGKHEARRED